MKRLLTLAFLVGFLSACSQTKNVQITPDTSPVEKGISEGIVTNKINQTVLEDNDKTVTVTEKVIRHVILKEEGSLKDENDYGLIDKQTEKSIGADIDGSLIETESKTFLPPPKYIYMPSAEEKITPKETTLLALDSMEFSPKEETSDSLIGAEIGYKLYESNLRAQDIQTLKNVAQMFRLGARKIRVYGYASCLDKDSLDTQKMNLYLALRRAEKVARVLIDLGVNEKDILIYSKVQEKTGTLKSRFTRIILDF